MDVAAHLLTERKFSCVEEAHLVLCQMIRSLIPNLAAHIGKNSSRNKKHTFTCSTVSHDKRAMVDTDQCKWKAILSKQDDGFFQFTSIDSFSDHSDDCIHLVLVSPKLKSVSRRRFFAGSTLKSRSRVAELLYQIPVVVVFGMM